MGIRSFSVFKGALCLALGISTAQACGPEFYPDLFVRLTRPDLPGQFAQGKLGLLQTGFARADLFVAYRYLSGGTLSVDEQRGWAPTYSHQEQVYGPDPQTPAVAQPAASETAVARWMLARKAFPDAPPGPIGQQGVIQVQTPQGYRYENYFLNCADDAFRTAAETLEARAGLWGATSPSLRDWIRAQDAVFSNCSGAASASAVTPAPAPPGSPALLTADRAYQTAAAHFYGRAFPDAAREFAAISKDAASPWQPGSGYLAARAPVRAAFFARHDIQAQADYDPPMLQAAEDQLHACLAAHPAPPWRDAAEKLLALVRIRLEPEQRTRELAALVTGPGRDANYSQDLKDLLWITAAMTQDGLRAAPNPYGQVPDPAHPGSLRPFTPPEAASTAAAERDTAFTQTVPERALAPILDWTLTVQSLSTQAPQHALDQWRATKALPWLVAALVLAADGVSSDLTGALNAAALIPEASPAWETVAFHRARVLLSSSRGNEGRAAIAALSSHLQRLPAAEQEPSSRNAIRGLKMLSAANASAFLGDASRSILVASSEEQASVDECQDVMQRTKRHYNCASDVGREQLAPDAASIFNEQAPLSVWLAAAKAESFSPPLRDAIAEEGWTRALLLADGAASSAFLTLLPPPLQQQATAQGSPLSPWMTLARNPGLRPYLDAGVQRAYSYDFVESYRDNWCYKPDSPAPASLSPAFLSDAEKQAGLVQARSLAALRSLDVGRAILRLVQAKPDDPQAAEALFLILRMIRYGCTEPAPAEGAAPAPEPSPEARGLLELKQQAARLLRRNYAASPWTKKAAPFAG